MEIFAQDGPFRLRLLLHASHGRGLCGYLTGGRAHVGGVAYAVPRPRSDGKGTTADVSCICGPGHKDVYAAECVAKRLCVQINETVCICAGIHYDNVGQPELDRIMALWRQAADRAAEEYQARKEARHV